ncbi:hypothetical protein GCM10009801_64390 [Streptomyces albiaxialis]|uniref:DUF1963 domain-containing protein n=1 Tax=Streptomyces albiaxialis TaxID=329523 RepID=A0ABN2WMQ7_9ACTN
MPQPEPLVFVRAEGPVDRPVTKLGGQPVWQGEPEWPLSRETGGPMVFMGQFALDGGRLAYLFMADDAEGYVDGTWDPEGGENALLVQPGGRVPGFLTVRAQAEGPTMGPDHLPGPGEPTDSFQFLGGPGIEPKWLQGEEEPGPDWHFVVQLTDGEPFHPNFGDAGVGYAFVSPDAEEGRFLWQCA